MKTFVPRAGEVPAIDVLWYASRTSSAFRDQGDLKVGLYGRLHRWLPA